MSSSCVRGGLQTTKEMTLSCLGRQQSCGLVVRFHFWLREGGLRKGRSLFYISPEIHVHTYICYKYRKHFHFFPKIKIFVLRLPLVPTRRAVSVVRVGCRLRPCVQHNRAFN